MTEEQHQKKVQRDRDRRARLKQENTTPGPEDGLVIAGLQEEPVRPLPTPSEIIAHDYPRVFLREPVDIYLAILNELVLARIWREHGGIR